MLVEVPSLLLSVLFHNFEIGITIPVALGAVALIGYLFGHRTHQDKAAALDAQRQLELKRASDIARQLETIAGSLRQDLASHHARLAGFKKRLAQAQEAENEVAWKSVCSEAEAILAPTMQLAQQISLAYDSIRQQSDALETFSQARTDPSTGIANVRALEQRLDVLIATARRSAAAFSIAFVCLDRDTSDTTAAAERRHKARLIELAELIQSNMRDNDFVARYGDEELVVVMQQTTLSGACVFADRLRRWVVERLSASVSCGIAEYQMNDDKKSLLGRADSAYYSAKAAGGNCLFAHSGTHIREFLGPGSLPPADPAKSPAIDGSPSLGTLLAPSVGDSFGLTSGSPIDAGL